MLIKVKQFLFRWLKMKLHEGIVYDMYCSIIPNVEWRVNYAFQVNSYLQDEQRIRFEGGFVFLREVQLVELERLEVF